MTNDPQHDTPEVAMVGWREWLTLPELGIPAIRAKTDTGARSSALHATEVELFRRDGQERVRFTVHPLRQHSPIAICCEARVLDVRTIRNSGGQGEQRYMIETALELGGRRWTAEVSLTDRQNMLFPMLLGRTALAGRFLVDVDRSYCFGRSLSRAYR